MAARQTPATRAKDTDRNDTCQILDSALSEGQLSMEEHGSGYIELDGAGNVKQITYPS